MVDYFDGPLCSEKSTLEEILLPLQSATATQTATHAHDVANIRSLLEGGFYSHFPLDCIEQRHSFGRSIKTLGHLEWLYGFQGFFYFLRVLCPLEDWSKLVFAALPSPSAT